MRSFIQNEAKQRFLNLQLTVVFNQTQLSEIYS